GVEARLQPRARPLHLLEDPLPGGADAPAGRVGGGEEVTGPERLQAPERLAEALLRNRLDELGDLRVGALGGDGGWCSERQQGGEAGPCVTAKVQSRGPPRRQRA